MLGIVPRSILLAAVLAGLVVAMPSAAAPNGSGKIAYATEGGSLYTVTADGRNPENLRVGGANNRLWSPRWSPDGTQVAFNELTGTPTYLLHVMNQDGSGAHLVATGAVALSPQPWSPDGSRIAWGPSGGAGDIYTASAAGGDVRRLTTDGLPKQPPVWSPTGSSLAYAAGVGDPQHWELFVVGADGSGPTQITSGGQDIVRNVQPRWSPDGTSIAFVRQDGSETAIYVVRPDGTERHRLVETYAYLGAAEPAWSPDGSKIAYTNSVNSGYSRYGQPGQEIFVVDADGSGERRLTELAPKLVADASPTWSPDGDQIVFRRGTFNASLVAMNPDGTCEQALPATGVSGAPSWQSLPGGPPAGHKTCRAVSVDARLTTLRDLSSIVIVGEVANEGTEPLRNVIVKFTATRHDLGFSPYGQDCSPIPTGIRCQIDRIEPGRKGVAAVRGRARRVGRDQRSRDVALRARVDVTADGPLLETHRESDEIGFIASRCTSRDAGRGRIDGTRFPDRICGRLGADKIHPGLGKDVVDAGAGRDVVHAQDGFGDRIRCGPGHDVVAADAKDQVTRDCERVRRAG